MSLKAKFDSLSADLDDVGSQITRLVLEQRKLERQAMVQVYGEKVAAQTYDRPVNFTKVTDTGEIEGWIYGTWGGEDYPIWNTALDPRMESGRLIHRVVLLEEYVIKFTAEKAADEAKQAEEHARRVEKLRNELDTLTNPKE